MEEIQVGVSQDAPSVDLAYNKFKTENDMIDMAKHFKEVVEDKDAQIKNLSKIVTVVYGTLTLGEIIHDDSYVIFLREYLEVEMFKLLGLEN